MRDCDWVLTTGRGTGGHGCAYSLGSVRPGGFGLAAVEARLTGGLRPVLAAACLKLIRNAAMQQYGHTASMTEEGTFVTVQSRGVVTIPPALRRRFGLDRPGAQLEVIERDDEIVLRPHVPVPTDQAWFWSERWQKMEGEADEEIAAGHVSNFEDVVAFLADLDA